MRVTYGLPVAAAFLAAALPVRCLAVASASITIIPATVSWSNAGYAEAALAADNTITMTATVKTSTTGTGSIVVSAPATVTGANGATLNTADIRFTCTGTTVSGQTLTTSMTALTPGGSATCATYAAKYSATSTITISFYLNDVPLNADTFVDNSQFSFIATAA